MGLKNEFPAGSNLRLLFIGISQGDASVALSLLATEGYLVQHCLTNSSEALDFALGQEWDVALSGYASGRPLWSDALRTVQARQPTLPFLIYDEEIGGEAAVAALRSGATGFVNKDRPEKLRDAISDLLSHRRSEKPVYTSPDFLQTLIDSIPMPVFYRNTDGVFIGCNAAFLQLNGRQKSEVLGKTVYDFYPREIAVQFDEVDGRLARELALQVNEHPYVLPDGRTRQVVVFKAPLFDAARRLIGIVGTIIDITERKEIYEAMLESESKFREIFNNSNDAIFLLELRADGMPRKIAEVNDVACQLTGIRREDLLTMRMSSVIRMDNPSEMVPRIQEFNVRGSALFNAKVLSRSGGHTDVELNCHLFTLGSGRYMHCTARDIRERKRAAFAKDSAMRFLQMLIDRIPAPVVYKYTDGVYRGCNAAYEEFMGLSKDQIIGKTVFDLNPREQAEKFYEDDLKLFQELRTRVSEFSLVSHTGKSVRCITSKAPLFDDDGQLIGLVCTIFDITERKLVEEALHESESKFREIFNNANDAIFLMEADEHSVPIRILEANDMALKWMGPARGRTSEVNLLGLITPEKGPSIMDTIRKLDAEGQVTAEFEFRLPDGKLMPIEVSAHVFNSGERRMIQAIVRDVTERRQYEQQLEQERLDLKRSNEELEQFAYVASHDLQEPLRMVSGYLKLLENRYGNKLDQDAREYIGFAVDGSARMQQMITDMLQYSRVSTRGKPPEPTDLEAVLATVLQNLNLVISESHTTVTHARLPVVKADAAQILHVLQNLLSNAIKFRKEGVNPAILISATRKGDLWEVGVSDNGIGIEPQYFDKLFVIFQRLHSRKDYPGNGIGLAMCKKIVERHGGHIWVESRPGEGSTFKFTLPAADGE